MAEITINVCLSFGKSDPTRLGHEIKFHATGKGLDYTGMGRLLDHTTTQFTQAVEEYRTTVAHKGNNK